MSGCLSFKSANCKNCYRCIRNCPVKSIRFSSEQANILQSDCILCGHCYMVCPQGAKVVRNDVPHAKFLINGGEPVYASIAPSFAARFPGMTIASMEKALKQLGFAGAEETAIGATLVKDEYLRLLKEDKYDVLISSCCHSVNLLIQKYYPKALRYLAPVLSPMLAHGAHIKNRVPGAKVIFIGPCIAKKDEAEKYPQIDCALTFEELEKWLEAENIPLEPLPDPLAPQGKTRIFPTTGGVIASMEKEDIPYTFFALDGAENCMNALEDISKGKLHKCFIEMSICPNACVGGPVMGESRKTPVSNYAAIMQYTQPEHFDVEKLSDMGKVIASTPKQREVFMEYEIKEVLRSMGKTLPAHELNCGACGYNSCRDKAVAVLQGKADINMCMPYIKERAQSFSSNIINNTPNGILILTESYEIIEVNSAACRLFNKNSDDMTGRQVVTVMDPTPIFDATMYGKEVKDRRVYLPDVKKWVDITINHDKSYHRILCIMHDVTQIARHDAEREEMRRRTMEVTDKVIQKQMRAVQEIASLLGESTAETKVALTKLKESMKDDLL